MSTLHFDTIRARQLVHETDQLSAAIQPAQALTSNNDEFAAALFDAIDRINSQARHLSDFLVRVTENSSRVISHAENQDASLGNRLESLS